MTMPQSAQRGSAIIYIILTMFLMMTSAAVILSGVLSKHVRSAQDYLASERAFAAANSGMEEIMYQVARDHTQVFRVSSQPIFYGNESASYSAAGEIKLGSGGTTGSPCVISVGTYRDTVRRVANGNGVNGCDVSVYGL